MNSLTQTISASVAEASAGPMRSPEQREGPSLPPIVLALALSLRVRAAFGECLESVSRIIGHLRAQIAWQTTEAAAVAAIDDDLEREFPLFVELFQNAPPKKRARALAILREIHRRTELRATELTPKCPAHLLEG